MIAGTVDGSSMSEQQQVSASRLRV
ncbi:MAG: hypothetical protein QG577_215, partial [Thermodesulfobacteriota bacterium]|nr:hypothetical protein [Thermodesulfobacteriota bacterium]